MDIVESRLKNRVNTSVDNFYEIHQNVTLRSIYGLNTEEDFDKLKEIKLKTDINISWDLNYRYFLLNIRTIKMEKYI